MIVPSDSNASDAIPGELRAYYSVTLAILIFYIFLSLLILFGIKAVSYSKSKVVENCVASFVFQSLGNERLGEITSGHQCFAQFAYRNRLHIGRLVQHEH